MLDLDLISTTARGLFLTPAGLPGNEGAFSVGSHPVSEGSLAAVEVTDAPAGCPIDSLEVIEVAPGVTDAWQTREIPLCRGMRLLGVVGGRFANRSISGKPPERARPPGAILDLLNKGGVIGLCGDPAQPVVKLEVLGSIEKNGRPVSISHLATIPRSKLAKTGETLPPSVPLVMVTGSDMEVGKTTCAASLGFSLRSAGVRVAYVKLTGTGRMRDLMRVHYGRPLGFFDTRRNAWDFVDGGLASTFSRPREEVRHCARDLLRHASRSSEIILAELADAPYFDGSLHVASDPWVQSWLRRIGLVICACDTAASTLTVHWIRSHMNLEEDSILISGRVANDPSLRREAERMAHVVSMSCATPGDLSPLGGEAAGGALADWVIRRIMNLRRVLV